MTTDNASERTTGEYITGRDDLRAWHYAHGDDEEPHQGFHDGSPGWTHCTCFGAAHRGVEPLLAEIERLREGMTTMIETWWGEPGPLGRVAFMLARLREGDNYRNTIDPSAPVPPTWVRPDRRRGGP